MTREYLIELSRHSAGFFKALMHGVATQAQFTLWRRVN